MPPSEAIDVTQPVADSDSEDTYSTIAQDFIDSDNNVEYDGESEQKEAPAVKEDVRDEEMDALAAEPEGEPADVEDDEPQPETDTAEPKLEPQKEPEPEMQPEPEPTPEVQVESVKQQPEPEPQQTEEQILQARQEALGELTKRFALTEDDEQNMLTNPGEVLPKFAAQLYLDVYDQVVRTVMGSLPAKVSEVISMQSAIDQATNAFYDSWKGKLDKGNKLHNDTVMRIATVYRQLNPKVSQEQFTAEVGAQSLMALGIPFNEIVDQAVPETPKPHRPARPTAVTPPPQPRQMNEYELMAEEMLADDS